MTDTDSIHVRIRTGEGRSFHDKEIHTDRTDEEFEAIREELNAFAERLDTIIENRQTTTDK